MSLQSFVNELVKLPFICHDDDFMKFFKINEQENLKFCCTSPAPQNFQCPGFDVGGTDVVVAEEKRLMFCSFAKPRRMFRASPGAVAVFRDNQIVSSLQFTTGVYKLAWNPARQSLAVLLASGLVSFYTLEGDSLKEEQKVKLLATTATAFSHAAENPYLLAASTDSKVIVFDTEAKTPSASSHTSRIVSVTSAFEEKEQLLFLGTNTGELRVCCLKNAQALATPLCTLRLRATAAQLTAMCYVAELEMLFVVIDSELIGLSFTETEVTNVSKRSVKSKIVRSKGDPQGLIKVAYSLTNFGFGAKQRATSAVFMYTKEPFPVHFLAIAASNGVVNLFQLPRRELGVSGSLPRGEEESKINRAFGLIAGWKFKANSIGKLAYAPSAQTLYVCAEDQILSISLAAFIPTGSRFVRVVPDDE